VPTFQSRNSGAIVITGSKQGITNPPGNAAYNASKAAVKTLAEHLSFDLKDTGVSVHLLVPGYTFTGLVCIRTPIQNHKLKQTQSGNVPGANKDKPDSAWSSAQVADLMYKKMDEGKFYIMCPDNDVSEELDKKRMLWSVGDIVNGRPPLTRWRPEFKEEVEEWMAKQKV
jgi:short-subunit dehydrogenase